MSASGHETISIRVPESSNATAEIPKQKMARPYIVAAISIALLFAGWGTWQYWEKLKLAVQNDGQGDSDQIELVAPLFDSEPQELASNPRLGKLASATGKNRGNAPGTPMADELTEDGSGHRAEIWLTGTIEVDDSDERIAIPQRISGGPSDSSVHR